MAQPHRGARTSAGLLAAGALAGWLSGCHAAKPAERLPDLDAPDEEVTAGIDEKSLDRSADPCRDFYQYACGGFIERNPVQPGSAGVTRLAAGRVKGLQAMLSILEQDSVGKVGADDPYGAELGALYKSCKAAGSGSSGLSRLGAELHAIGELASPDDLARAASDAQALGARAFFRLDAEPSLDDATRLIAWVGPGGMGLPAPEYYLDEGHADVRDRYVEHVGKMMSLAGMADEAAGEAVLKLETELARGALSPDEERDPQKQHHPLDRAGLAAAAPHFPWEAFLKRSGVPEAAGFNAVSLEGLSRLDAALAKASPADLRRYLAFRVVEALGAHASQALTEEEARFHNGVFYGSPEAPPRLAVCVAEAEELTGPALSRPFAARLLGPGDRPQVSGMVEQLRGQLDARLGAASWLDEPTRAEAKKKLSQIAVKVASPDAWPNDPPPPVDGEEYVANRIKVTQALRAADMSLLGKPFDRGRWWGSTTIFNAFYEPQGNQVVVAAGILVPPVYSAGAPPAVNWGTIGMVAGHELTHGFDDQGRRFDGSGNLRDFWSPEVASRFEERASCLASQFDAYEVIPGVHVDGRLTLGENIADLGGVRLAHASMLADPALAGADKGEASRQFFTAYAQLWCANVSDAYARTAAVVDPHAPARFRVNGPLANVPAFAEAFGCQAGSPMAPADRCEVW